MSLSVMPARKRLDLVGKMWWIILNWKAITTHPLSDLFPLVDYV